jgi:hypothetical protein
MLARMPVWTINAADAILLDVRAYLRIADLVMSAKFTLALATQFPLLPRTSLLV